MKTNLSGADQYKSISRKLNNPMELTSKEKDIVI